jgi:inosine-uridine nucleoside N-ribohydrolase
VRIHLDTDLGGDPDDACALAMLLGWPGVEITGITTTIDPGGQRAGYVEHLLRLAGRAGIPVVAGAERSLSHDRIARPEVGERYWPPGIEPKPGSTTMALEVLEAGIDVGATLVAIGPYTNLALLEQAKPGSLARAPVVVMGGWLDAPGAGLPPWGPERDFNVAWDLQAARTVLGAAGDLTLVTLPATLGAPLRRSDLPRLRSAGPLGELLARQSAAHAFDAGKAALGSEYDELPDDLVNFHYDPMTCAVAAGWDGVTVEDIAVQPVAGGDALRLVRDPSGPVRRIVTEVDGEAFAGTWLAAVKRASADTRSRGERR